MPIKVRRVKKTVVVDKVLASGVVRRVDVNQLDLPGVRADQVPQGVVVVALNDEIAPRRSAARQRRVDLQAHEVGIEGLVGRNVLLLPDQAIRRLAVAELELRNQLFAAQVFVVCGHPGVFLL